MASLTVFRLMPYRCMSVVSDGTGAPGASSPVVICCRSRSASCLYAGRSLRMLIAM